MPRKACLPRGVSAQVGWLVTSVAKVGIMVTNGIVHIMTAMVATEIEFFSLFH